MYNLTGSKITSLPVKKGNNNYNFDGQSGIYILRRNDNGNSLKLVVMR
jgi:hypothetical protein